jgi:hypothetical protein
MAGSSAIWQAGASCFSDIIAVFAISMSSCIHFRLCLFTKASRFLMLTLVVGFFGRSLLGKLAQKLSGCFLPFISVLLVIVVSGEKKLKNGGVLATQLSTVSQLSGNPGLFMPAGW